MTKETTEHAIVFTDGACLGNPGPGGYAAVVTIAGDEQIIVGRDTATTNNKMEMLAAIKALEAVPHSIPIIIHSDSQYVIKGATQWLKGWKAKGWRKADGKPVLNQELWLEIDRLIQGRKIAWQWVKGHAGHEQNERVDRLANAESQKAAEAIGIAGRLR
ncbi:ribonuclease HI [Microvirga sp. HBU67558]|uniref:ribonuclease HI n=1 Tax=Microvirga TaxID=186650 RepID=UPI001B378154|nr:MULTISPECIES: ribonuclease HI [unclassified Microvirga]MBQ0824176.1 ribonuclease HI [Microvirga sp. HBU67558]